MEDLKILVKAVANKVVEDINDLEPAYMESGEVVDKIIEYMGNELGREVDLDNNEDDNDLFYDILDELSSEMNYIADGCGSGHYVQKSAKALYKFIENDEKVDDAEWGRCFDIECDAYIKLENVYDDLKNKSEFWYKHAIKDSFRELTKGFTQKQFCEFIGIPRRTLENWLAGTRIPPEYVYQLIRYKVENEKR